MKSYKPLLSLPSCALIMVAACGGGGGNHQTITTSGPNVQTITVNAGPDNDYVNGASWHLTYPIVLWNLQPV